MNVVYFIRTALNLIDDFEKKIKKIYINILRIITNSFKVLTDSSEWSNQYFENGNGRNEGTFLNMGF